jgi:glycosyltransferase involved in cell wall biosynthesis
MSDAPRRMTLVHFVGEGIFSPVLDSQVLVPLRLLGERARHIKRFILFLTSIRHRYKDVIAPREDQIRTMLPGVGIRFKYRPMLGTPFQDRIWAGLLKRSLARWDITGSERVVLHCRGQNTGAAGVALKRRDDRIRVLLDMRGDPLDEVPGKGLVGRYQRRFSEKMLARALAGADGLNTVTRHLTDRLLQTGFLAHDLPRIIVSCCADTNRFFFDPEIRAGQRAQLAIEDKFVVCYCGAMSHWQRPDAIAEAFAAIVKEVPDAHMLAVSRDAGPLLDHLERVGVGYEQVTVRSASHDKVGLYLMAADVGLLLREDTPTNRVASPVKFAEYLRCGLPVILTPNIGDFGELAMRRRVGRTITFPVRGREVVEAVRVIRGWLEIEGDDCRRWCSDVAAEELSWEGQLDRLIELYGTLAK